MTRPTFLSQFGASIVVSCLLLAISLPLQSCGGGSTTTTSTVKTIVVTPATSSVSVSSQQAFAATAQDSSGATVTGIAFTWASSSPNVATIDTSGVVTGLNVGTTQITASGSGVTSSPVTLTVTPVVASVSISPITASIKVGETKQFIASATDSKGNAISGAIFSWSNSFSGVATISNTGLVTAVSPGTVIITATSGGVTSPAATLTVTP